jgi:hypothetical protein
VVTHDQKKYIKHIFSATLADGPSATKSSKLTRWLFRIDNIFDIDQNTLAAILFDWLKPTWDSGGGAHVTEDVEKEILAAYQMASVPTEKQNNNVSQEKIPWQEVFNE